MCRDLSHPKNTKPVFGMDYELHYWRYSSLRDPARFFPWFQRGNRIFIIMAVSRSESGVRLYFGRNGQWSGASPPQNDAGY